jgi:hypothetical protein
LLFSNAKATQFLLKMPCRQIWLSLRVISVDRNLRSLLNVGWFYQPSSKLSDLCSSPGLTTTGGVTIWQQDQCSNGPVRCLSKNYSRFSNDNFISKKKPLRDRSWAGVFQNARAEFVHQSAAAYWPLKISNFFVYRLIGEPYQSLCVVKAAPFHVVFYNKLHCNSGTATRTRVRPASQIFTL